MERIKRILIIENVLVALGVIVFIVASQIAMDMDMKCTMLKNLHIYCPGCGGTRSLYSLLTFKFLDSIRYNISLPFGVFTYIYYNVRAIVALVKNQENYFKREKYVLIYVFIAILLLNFVVRNVLLIGFGIDFIGDILPRA